MEKIKALEKHKDAILLHYIDQLNNVRTEHEYFELLATKITAIIRRFYYHSVKQWEREIAVYSYLQKKAFEEGVHALMMITGQLSTAGLLNDQIVEQNINLSYDPYANLNSIFNILLQKGHVDIVEKYVEVEVFEIFEQQYICSLCRFIDKEAPLRDLGELLFEWQCPKCQSDMFYVDQELIPQKRMALIQPFLPAYKFGSAAAELHNRYHDYDLNNIKNAYAAWQHLLLAERSFKSQREFLKNKKLLYQKVNQVLKENNEWRPTPQAMFAAMQRDGRLIELQTFRCYMRTVQNKQRLKQYVYLFKRSYFEQYIRVILNEIMNNKNHQFYQDSLLRPHSIRIYQETGLELLMKVEWVEGIAEIFRLHSFHFDQEKKISGKNIKLENDYQSFAKAVTEKPGSPINKPNDDSKNTHEYLKRLGLSGVLAEIFTLAITSTTVTLRTFVEGKDLSDSRLKKLHSYLRKLSFVAFEMK